LSSGFLKRCPERSFMRKQRAEKLKMLMNLVREGKCWEDLKPQGLLADSGICPWLANSLSSRREGEHRGALCRREGERALCRRQNGSRIKWGGIFRVEEFCAGSRRCKSRIWGHVSCGRDVEDAWNTRRRGSCHSLSCLFWVQPKIF